MAKVKLNHSFNRWYGIDVGQVRGVVTGTVCEREEKLGFADEGEAKGLQRNDQEIIFYINNILFLHVGNKINEGFDKN